LSINDRVSLADQMAGLLVARSTATPPFANLFETVGGSLRLRPEDQALGMNVPAMMFLPYAPREAHLRGALLPYHFMMSEKSFQC
jgi:hypothetical protein